jgi:hypothetical protein
MSSTASTRCVHNDRESTGGEGVNDSMFPPLVAD